MKILLDTCVWGGAKAELQANGHDVVWTGDLAADPGDEAILAQAHQEGRILITLDKDFGELAIVHAKPHCGIVRLVNIRAKQQASMCEAVLAKHADELLLGAIVTAEPGRLRVHPPPDPSAD
jgi:predicted nuclease of predicted toxin-antitoxin system